MDKQIIAGIVAIIVIFIIIIIYLVDKLRTADEELTGFWVSDRDFADDAEISSMYLYIGEPESAVYNGTTVVRPAYIVINNDICNQKLEFEYTAPISAAAEYKVRAKVKYHGKAADDNLWGDTVNITLNTKKHFLKITSADSNSANDKKTKPTLHAFFWKDNEITATADSADSIDISSNKK